MRTISIALATAVTLAAAAPAHAIDSVSIEAGTGNSTDMWRLGAQVDWQRRWMQGPNWHVGGYWDFQLGEWRGHSDAGDNQELVDISVTPVFRLQRNELSGLFLEGGIGAHLLSKTRINARRRFGSAFQFGSHFGIGYRFGARGGLEIGARYQHVSNGDIEKPNNGINFWQLRFQYRF